MMIQIIFIALVLSMQLSFANDWSAIPIPADLGIGKKWQLQENVSDNFNYEAAAVDAYQEFDSKWKNEYVNGWEGKGGAKHAKDKSHVTGGELCLESDFVGDDPDQIAYYAENAITYIHSGDISSLNTVTYPVFVEARVKMNEIPLASCFWMISMDQTEEIDILEAFGTDRPTHTWYSQRLHLSHHTFIREPFQDYQPRDTRSWYTDGGKRWSASYFRIGVYWKSPFELEYYVDGEMVRSLYRNAVADKAGSTWIYSYAIKNSKDSIPIVDGYQTLTQHSTSSDFSQDNLVAASNASTVSIIDAYNYLGGNGLTADIYLVFSVGQQTWSGIYPSVEELDDADKSVYKTDWVRVYNAVDDENYTGIADAENSNIVSCVLTKTGPDTFSITNIEEGEYTISLFSLNGIEIRTMRKVSYADNRIEIDMQDQAKGIYILAVQDENSTKSFKIVK